MGGMQLIGLVVLYLREHFNLESASVLGVALSVISVVTIDVNLESLANYGKYR